MAALLAKLVNAIVSVLPVSPFPKMLEGLHETLLPYLGWLNWFIPMGTIEALFVAWTAAIVIWYAWRALASWLHMVS